MPPPLPCEDIQLILAIGEILFDVFPSYRRLGGAPFNFAYHADRFGWRVRFLSRVGNDAPGREILATLRERRFDAAFIQIDRNHPTGKVCVELDESGGHDFDIEPDAAYDYLAFAPAALVNPPDPVELLYFGTLIQRTRRGFETLQRYLQQKSAETRCFYDINLRPRSYHEAAVKASLKHTDVLKLNHEELEIIKSMLRIRQDTADSVRRLMDEFDIEMIALTKGADGSELYTARGCFREAPVPTDSVIDTVGAGDAYAAVLAIGYLQRRDPQQIIRDATRFAARVCGMEGAVPSGTAIYRDFMATLKADGDEKK